MNDHKLIVSLACHQCLKVKAFIKGEGEVYVDSADSHGVYSYTRSPEFIPWADVCHVDITVRNIID